MQDNKAVKFFVCNNYSYPEGGFGGKNLVKLNKPLKLPLMLQRFA
jgi:hypothetical protein